MDLEPFLALWIDGFVQSSLCVDEQDQKHVSNLHTGHSCCMHCKSFQTKEALPVPFHLTHLRHSQVHVPVCAKGKKYPTYIAEKKKLKRYLLLMTMTATKVPFNTDL